MKIQSIKLKHTYHFNDLMLDFDAENKAVTLILGDQGTGKTAILKNLYQALTWFPARFKDLRTAGVVMLDQDIQHATSQSKIEVQVRFPAEIGRMPESSDAQEKDVHVSTWSLYKTINPQGIGLSKVETAELEQLVGLYQQAIKEDPLQGIPMIAYYPSDRFINEINLLSKNNPGVLQVHAAFELASIPFTTYARFFEWFREISDIENAQTAQLFQHIISDEQLFDQEDDLDFHSTLLQAHAQLHAPSLRALKSVLNSVFPELTDIYLEYHPKLQLMVNYQGQDILYQQLPNTLKSWVALVGDVVRRLCLLNPLSLYPCLEGEGVLIIDQIDAQLDQNTAEIILERLHEAFPQVQIIASGNQEALLQYAEHYHCIRLENQHAYPFSTQDQYNQYQAIYSSFLQDTLQQHPDEQKLNADSEQALLENKATVSPDELFEQFQKMQPEQQDKLRQMLQSGDDATSHQHLT
ncbi:AAA family ATPase [Acinetobacter gerneri]|uniref:AAA family ATPase n=1 Tax=Acinetobacter gerneri TaxID=202952 RepID=UPI0032157725